MYEQLFYLEPKPGISLQAQIQEIMVSAILDGHFPPGSLLPSCRKLAKYLKVSRNTVVFAYEKLADEGYITTSERKGHYVSEDVKEKSAYVKCVDESTINKQVDWQSRFQFTFLNYQNIDKPEEWRHCQYPFICGQLDSSLFSINEWRECCRIASSRATVGRWLADQTGSDDSLLIDQLRTRVLPRRGIRCAQDEILVTLGTQHSLYMLARILMNSKTVVGIEDPGYVDARNIFCLAGATIQPLTVDLHGVEVNQQLARCDYVYVTPSHQSPTTVTMPMARRQELLAAAEKYNFILIEDDYESEFNFVTQPSPALKGIAKNDRVIYVGSLSKTLAPGVRLGYMVAAKPLIQQAIALRRLMLRHPPANNQHIIALFLSRGYHDSFIRRLAQAYRNRWLILQAALKQYLPKCRIFPSFGGSTLWVEMPTHVNTTNLQQLALKQGIFIEAGRMHFLGNDKPDNFMRLGFSFIQEELIEEGIRQLAELINGLA
ncbi:PLP-dependent aminotransferase family protein [Spartinivicinus poritis]|uniref:PLP-dependent aminotransferase family protein n=1 Tax=Spartinivicinus poritis TaxID=2994640 RepID=A0ABT5UHY2_9GAMM|nr:PLP-dependent aminotransferase family protein [Spartinivicinus sp. A2-2]MDE1465132.1 PLP-dependent aminotransferase family protein [Spartinivicinus sp. A2-2]